MKEQTAIRFLKGVGEKRAAILVKQGIDTVGALLRFFPRAYADWSKLCPIEEAPVGEKVCVKATVVTEIEEHFVRAKMTLYRFVAADETGARMLVTLFNNKYLAARLHRGSTYLFYGEIVEPRFQPQMSSPQIREAGDASIRPIYPASADLSSKAFEKLMQTALASTETVDPLPAEILARNGLCDLQTALREIHFPQSPQALQNARRRLVFEELFLLQTTLLLLREKRKRAVGRVLQADRTAEFESLLPFSFTAAQKRVVAECGAELCGGRRMNRLVQGDVGSGKTAVAAALLYSVAKNGLQGAMMAPTEILAEQHFATLSKFFENTGVQVVLLTGSLKKSQKDAAKAALASGAAAVAVGTHALLTEDVAFADLGLVITDEQHRFGVEQRAKLAAKGDFPHTLVMSATPIPQTLALMLYGDLDISILDEYPKGRQPIETYCVDGGYRARVLNYVKKHLDGGLQGYIVCPLVEAGESDCKSAEEYYLELANGFFANYRIGLLHGQMKPKEKDAVMRDFADGTVQLLVCTTVVEVGVDVPNAAIMVIENAERFGLSQLHQLRGRIGRGTAKSTCILISDAKDEVTVERLQVIRQNNDGFKIADADLALRGPGDFLGRRQHGLPSFRIADLSADLPTLRKAGEEARAILVNDPTLKLPEHASLRAAAAELYQKMKQI